MPLKNKTRTGGLLGRILQSKRTLSPEQVAQVLATQSDLPYVASLADAQIPPQAQENILRLDALQFNSVPYKETEGKLVIATADPRQRGEILAIANCPVQFVVSPEPQVRDLIEKTYAEDKGRLGETLLKLKKINRPQLRHALQEQAKASNTKPLGQILTDLGYVEEEEIENALNHQRSGGGKLEDTLVQSGKISPDMLARSMAMQLGFDLIDSAETCEVDPFVVTLIPEVTVKKYHVMPISLEGDNQMTMVVAMKDPRRLEMQDDFRLLTGKEIRPVVATEKTITDLINRFYKPKNPITPNTFQELKTRANISIAPVATTYGLKGKKENALVSSWVNSSDELKEHESNFATNRSSSPAKIWC